MVILILAEETIHENTKCVMDITIYIMQHKKTQQQFQSKHLSEKKVDMKLMILL